MRGYADQYGYPLELQHVQLECRILRFVLYPLIVDSNSTIGPDVIGPEYWAEFSPVLSTRDLERIYRVKAATVYRFLQEGIIPAHRVPGAWIVYRDSVARSIEEGAAVSSVPLSLIESVPEEMTIEDTARLYGRKRGTIYSWLQDGLIPGRKLGKKWVLNRSEHVAFINDAVRRPGGAGS